MPVHSESPRDVRSLTQSIARIIPAICLSIATLAHAAPPPGYYDSVDTSSAASLRATLHEVIDDHSRFPYTSSSTDTWDILNAAQQDPADSGKIIDVYGNQSINKMSGGSGPYNREHSWPKSYGFPDDGGSNYPYTDCYQLFLCDSGYNSTRNNKIFDRCIASCSEEPTVFNNGQGGGTGTYPGNSNWTSGSSTSGNWEVWRGRRGDIARAQFYLDVRYEGGTHGITGANEPDLILTDNVSLIANSSTGQNLSVAYMGLRSVLLQWHHEDPVDDWERNRNDVVSSYQGNRNPFIDHPEWVDCIFENVCGGISAPTGLAANAGDGIVSLTWNSNVESILAGYNIYRATNAGGPFSLLNGSLLSTPAFNDTSVFNDTLYFYFVTAVANDATESAASTMVSALPTMAGGPPTAPVGLMADAADGEVTLSWTANPEGDVSGYNVWRATTSSGPYTMFNAGLVVPTTYTDTTVVNNTTYYYVITAVNASLDESPFSNEVAATPMATTAGNIGPPWINEFHYDNNGGDTNEFVEIAGAAGVSLNGWRVIGYNGNGGGMYDQVSLSGTIPDQDGCIGTLAFDFDGMQNGAPDGLALVDADDNVRQFISYEGTFTAVGGPAAGMVSTNIGVDEQPAPEVGASLQLLGTGAAYEDFSWQETTAHSRGTINNSQTFDGCAVIDMTPPTAPTGLTATPANGTVTLNWNTNSEGDLAGYHVYRSDSSQGTFVQINGVLLVNNTFVDGSAANCTTYFYVVTALDDSSNESNDSNMAIATPSTDGPAAADCDSNDIPDECEADSDGDGAIDACDGCPTDIDKLAPGNCGCNVPDIADGDINEDGFVNGRDIQSFVTALITQSQDAGVLCHGDFNNSSALDAADIAPMIDELIGQ